MGLANTLDLTLLIQAKTAGMEAIDSANTKLGGLAMGAAAAGAVIAGGLGLAMVDSVKKAATFQESLTALVTGGGELQKNMNEVRNGILQMSGQVGVSANQLAQGMYSIESAGFHGAQGLAVLKAAAEGAKVGSADMGTVADAVTSTLNAYGLKASSATAVTNELVETVASGKMHMTDLAGSLSAVLPVAAAAHISFAQVGGAIATMTAQGVSADEAAQNVANTIRGLQNPTSQAVDEMSAMGLNAQTVSQQLGSKGLNGTLAELVGAITKNMGPSGLVIQKAFQSAQFAAQDANEEIGAMPPNLQKIAKAYQAGSLTQTQFTADTKDLSAEQRKLLTQFAQTEQKTDSFNQELKKGGPASQTFSAALSTMLGGATGLNTALLVTGSHQATFDQNVQNIGKSSKTASKDVQGWGDVTKDFNFKMSQLSAGLDATAIKVGTSLLPSLSKLADYVTKNVLPAAQKLIDKLTTDFQQAVPVAEKVATKIGDIAKPILQIAGDVLKFTGIKPLLAGIAGAVTAWAIWQTALNVQMGISKGLGMVTFVQELIGQMMIAASTEEGWAGVQAALNVLMDANPIGLIVIAIGLLVAAVVLVITHWKQVEQILGDVWDLFKGFAGWVGGEAVKIFDGLNKQAGQAFSQLGTVAHAGLTDVEHFFSAAWSDVTSGVGDFFSGLGTKVHEGIDDVGNWLKSHWLEILEAALLILPGGYLIDLGILIATHLSQIKQVVTDGFDKVKHVIGDAWQWVQTKIHDVCTDIENWLTGWEQRHLEGLENLYANVKQLWHDAWQWIQTTVKNIATDIENWLTGWEQRHYDGLMNLFANVKQLWHDAWQWLEDTVRNIATDLENWIHGWEQRHWQGWLNLVANVKQTVHQGWTDLQTDIHTIMTTIESDITGWKQRLVNLITDLKNGIGNLASGIADNLKKGFVSGVKDIRGVFDTLFTALGNLPLLGGVAKSWKSTIDAIASQGLATGGVIGGVGGTSLVMPFSRVGSGFVTNGPKAIVGEGNPAHPEYVIPSDPIHRQNAANLWHDAGKHMGFLESGGVLLGGTVAQLAAGGAISSDVGTYGGQCEVWVESVENVHFPTELASQMQQFVNTRTPAVGEIFVSTMPPDGHTGIVVGNNTVEDSNWQLDGMVRIHPLSDIPDIVGYIDLNKGLPPGVTASNAGAGAGGGVGGLLAKLLAGPEAVANKAMSGLGGWAGALGTGILQQLEQGLAGYEAGGTGTSGAAGTSAQVLSWIQQAEAKAGVGSDWTQGLSIIIDHESGGNPAATNNYDVNAAAGNASVGLMQLTASNRAAFTPPGMNPMDPVAQIVAGIKYIESRYGSLSAVPGVKSVLSGGPYLPYDSGGLLPPGVSQVYNGTGSPEPVLTGAQWDALMGGQAGPGAQAQIINALNEMAGAEQQALSEDEKQTLLLQQIAAAMNQLAQQRGLPGAQTAALRTA